MDEKTKINILRGVKEKVPTAKEINIYVKEKTNRIPLPPNVMVFQTFAFLAATTLKPSTNKVLMLFFANSEYENYISMDVFTISEQLSISERSVITALKELEKENIVIKTKHPSDRRRHDYFLNPFASWKGNSESRKKLMQIIPDNQLELFGVLPQDSADREKQEIKNKLPTHQS